MDKNKLVICAFFGILIFVGGVSLIKEDEAVIKSERRSAQTLPNLTLEEVFTGDYFKDFEKYLSDNIAFRETFRGIKTLSEYNLLLKQDNNNIVKQEGHLIYMDYQLRENDIINGVKTVNEIYDEFFTQNNVYYGIIPDKSYFLAKGYFKMDFARLNEILEKELNSNIKIIPMYDKLSLDSYYDTDSHIKQDSWQKVIKALSEEMNFAMPEIKAYQRNCLKNFKGVYYGQNASLGQGEDMCYLTSSLHENLLVYDYDTKGNIPIYTLDQWESIDSYNIFLNGASSKILIENKEAKNDKTLIIFRDSFGSSIAPLLVESYSTILLVDLRYTNTEIALKGFDYEEADILFLYSTSMINSGTGLKQ